MAADALTAFLQRDFARTDQSLLSLTSDTSSDLHDVSTLTDDPRIKHNALVAKFYSSISATDLDKVIFFVSEFLPPDQRPSTVSDFFRVTISQSSAVKFLYTHVGPVALYNVAVIAYHRLEVHAAATIGELLFENIEAMDDWLALTTCFLLTDVHLRLADISSALTVLAYAEKLLPNFARSSSTVAADSSEQLAEIRTLTPDWSGRATTILEAPASYEHAKFCMHIYNARLCALTDGAESSRSIRKEAKSAVLAADDAHSRPTSAALLVKARVEQNCSKGLRILASVVNQCPPHMLSKVRPLALNSLGVLHHRLGRHALSASYFEQSRRAFVQLFHSPSLPQDDGHAHLSIFSSVKDSHVAYNLALQYMTFGDFGRALDLFTACARTDKLLASHSPILWIRMAECCVGMDCAGSESRSSLSVEGRGRTRRMVMRSSHKSDTPVMEYAITCARASIAILDSREAPVEHGPMSNGMKEKNDRPTLNSTKTRDTKEAKSAATDSPTDPTPDALELRGVAWLLIAYASLSFDPNAVIDACDKLQKLYPKADNERWTLGLLYAAEAYCLLGRPKDAAKLLAPLISSSVPLETHVREAAFINIGLTHASSGDFATAARAVRVALKLHNSGPRGQGAQRKEVLLAASYVFLRNGETTAACEALHDLRSPSA